MTDNQKLFSEFPPITTQEWMDKITTDLKGADFEKKLVWKTNEGFKVKPFYRMEDLDGLKQTEALPGEYPYVRGIKKDNNWLIRQDIEVDDMQKANAKIKEILTKGIESVGLKIKKKDVNKENITLLLNGIDATKIELNFSTCVKASAQLAEILIQYFTEKGYNLSDLHGSINFDPYKRMLTRGKDFENYIDETAQLITTAKALPNYRVVAINASFLANAGASITQELGYALAWGADYLSKLTDKGLTVEEVASNIKFNMGVGSNYFMEIAKFRTARMIWAQIVRSFSPQCPNAEKMQIHAETSTFNLTIYDAHVNLLRTQTEAMSATLGGVSSLTVNAFDKAYKTPDDFSERIARNQQLLLKEESHFGKVVDPAAGSYYIETLTAAIAEQAWQHFLAVDEEDGFYECVKKGIIQDQVNNSGKTRKALLATRRESLLGTNQFPNFNEQASGKIEAPVEKEGCGCTHQCAPNNIKLLNMEREACEFEALRLSTEKAAKRPKAFMLTIGKLAMRLARAQFSCNFFAVAGYQVLDNLGFQTVTEGVEAAREAEADIIVLCSSDDEYATYAPEAKQLIGNSAILVIAGAPACMDELKEKGIDNFIHVRSNVLEELKMYNNKLGINAL